MVGLGAVLAACGVAAACSLVSGETGAPPDPGEAACAEVRAGVDAFNAGDFEEAVARFRAAVPPAEERAERTPSARADLLLEAVEWYAALPPEDYPRASRRSEQFARYRAVTLAQCVVGEPGDDPPGEDPPGEDRPVRTRPVRTRRTRTSRTASPSSEPPARARRRLADETAARRRSALGCRAGAAGAPPVRERRRA